VSIPSAKLILWIEYLKKREKKYSAKRTRNFYVNEWRRR
jgi:hypothetical protein